MIEGLFHSCINKFSLKALEIMNNKLGVGLFGFGCVGKGYYDLHVRHPQINIKTTRIVVKDPNKKRDVSNGVSFSYDDFDILNDSEIRLMIEAINHTGDALLIARNALSSGKTLVTASKKMVAENFPELVALQQKHGGRLLYEASSAASIPIIRILEEYFSNENILSVEAILNGTSNFILTSIFNDYSNYDTTLQQAKERGFAESDPALDVGGYDAAHKLVIISAHAFGTVVHPRNVFTYGIDKIYPADVQYALQRGWNIKQVANAFINDKGKLVLYVAPKFVKPTNQIFYVSNENNGILINAQFSGPQFYFGKGAGSYPTGSAVLADVVASLNNFSYSYSKLRSNNAPEYSTDALVSVYLRYPNSFDLSLLEFVNVNEEETMKGINTSVIAGSISLEELYRNRSLLDENKISLLFY